MGHAAKRHLDQLANFPLTVFRFLESSAPLQNLLHGLGGHCSTPEMPPMGPKFVPSSSCRGADTTKSTSAPSNEADSELSLGDVAPLAVVVQPIFVLLAAVCCLFVYIAGSVPLRGIFIADGMVSGFGRRAMEQTPTTVDDGFQRQRTFVTLWQLGMDLCMYQ